MIARIIIHLFHESNLGFCLSSLVQTQHSDCWRGANVKFGYYKLEGNDLPIK